jgi:hypothetical protein
VSRAWWVQGLAVGDEVAVICRGKRVLGTVEKVRGARLQVARASGGPVVLFSRRTGHEVLGGSKRIEHISEADRADAWRHRVVERLRKMKWGQQPRPNLRAVIAALDSRDDLERELGVRLPEGGGTGEEREAVRKRLLGLLEKLGEGSPYERVAKWLEAGPDYPRRPEGSTWNETLAVDYVRRGLPEFGEGR